MASYIERVRQGVYRKVAKRVSRKTDLQHRFAQGGMLRAENHRTYKCNFCVNICVMLNDKGVAIKKQVQVPLGLLTLVLFSFLKIVLLFLSYHTDVTRS